MAQTKALLDDARQELSREEGALSKVGGASVREEVARLAEAVDAAVVREKELEVDADAWKLLKETLVAVQNEEGAHLGRVLTQPVSRRFAELTQGRYGALNMDADMKAEGVSATGTSVEGATVMEMLSVGTRDQLATLIRLTIAEQLGSAIVLDDHLVHTDPKRLEWFKEALVRASLKVQVLVLTCRPLDYLTSEELAGGAAVREVAGGTIRVLDAARLLTRSERAGAAAG